VPSYRNQIEADLLDALKKGDHRAFRELYDRHWGMLYFHAWKMLGDEAEAKDIVQDVFCRLWTHATHIQVKGSLSAYLFAAVRNKVLNLIRDNKVRRTYTEKFASYLEEHRNTTFEKMDEKELLQTIEEVILSLPLKMRRVFELSRKDLLSHRQIAEQLDISEKTVKRQISNALQILRARLNTPEDLLFVYLFLVPPLSVIDSVSVI